MNNGKVRMATFVEGPCPVVLERVFGITNNLDIRTHPSTQIQTETAVHAT